MLDHKAETSTIGFIGANSNWHGLSAEFGPWKRNCILSLGGWKSSPLSVKTDAVPNSNSIVVIVIRCQQCHFLCHFGRHRHRFRTSNSEFKAALGLPKRRSKKKRVSEFVSPVSLLLFWNHQRNPRHRKSRSKRWHDKIEHKNSWHVFWKIQSGIYKKVISGRFISELIITAKRCIWVGWK